MQHVPQAWDPTTLVRSGGTRPPAHRAFAPPARAQACAQPQTLIITTNLRPGTRRGTPTHSSKARLRASAGAARPYRGAISEYACIWDTQGAPAHTRGPPDRARRSSTLGPRAYSVPQLIDSLVVGTRRGAPAHRMRGPPERAQAHARRQTPGPTRPGARRSRPPAGLPTSPATALRLS